MFNFDLIKNTIILLINISLSYVTVQPSHINTDFIKIPTSLTFNSEYDLDDSQCYSASCRENGDILIGGANGLYCLDKNYVLKKYNMPFKIVTAAIEHHQAIYILHREEDTCKVEMCLPDLKQWQTLFEFKNTSKNVASMSASNRYIVVYVPTGSVPRRLIIYDFITKQCKTTQADIPCLPYFLPDGHLLAVHGECNQLSKYSIEEGELTLIWSCKDLPNIRAVCADSNGLIYGVTCITDETCQTTCLYIISPTGKEILLL